MAGRRTQPVKIDGQTIDGLYRKPNTNIWRITATKPAIEFRCADERLALQKFRHWQSENQRTHIDLVVPVDPASSKTVLVNRRRSGQPQSQTTIIEHYPTATTLDDAGDPASITKRVPEHVLYAWAKNAILADLISFRQKTGLPLSLTAPISRSIALADLQKNYESRTDITKKAQNRSVTIWKQFVSHTGASSLDELTTPKLLAYREFICTQCDLEPGSIALYFGRVKAIISYGRKMGMDAESISAALNRCRVLFPPPNHQKYDAQPISPENLKSLLAAADDKQRASILLSLNALLHLSEMLTVRWDEINLDAGTYVSQRSKTGIVRVAVLWPETVAALRKIQQRNEFVFISRHGSTYHVNSYYKVWANLKTRAGITGDLDFDSLRDGGYTAACGDGVEFALTQILAGHKTAGKSMHYIARNPRMVSSACAAIRAHYAAAMAAQK